MSGAIPAVLMPRRLLKSSADLGSTRSVHFADDDYYNFPLLPPKNDISPHSFISYNKFSPLENADTSKLSYTKVSVKNSTPCTSPEHLRSSRQGTSASRPISPLPSSPRNNDKHKQDLSNTYGTSPRNTNNANNNSTSLEEARRECLISLPNGRSPNISRDGVLLNHNRTNYPRDSYPYEHDRLPTRHMDMPMLSMTLKQFLNHNIESTRLGLNVVTMAVKESNGYKRREKYNGGHSLCLRSDLVFFRSHAATSGIFLKVTPRPVTRVSPSMSTVLRARFQQKRITEYTKPDS
ncbi:hypothetical protein G5I_04111 [Acromyrmex echinatior]|uniref:Uncharacterized protein n=1 Tax=Acromyrmex echinatior TaxID=103372 RepID=F4WES0_ACREC|nr:hypothetical protein G5I_04111 [Acromyrmex echinatior]